MSVLFNLHTLYCDLVFHLLRRSQGSEFKQALERLGVGGLSAGEKSLLVRRFDPLEDGVVSGSGRNRERNLRQFQSSC